VRLDGYVRVSQVRGRSGDSFISPAQQRDRIEAWCRALDHEVGEIFEELDASGAKLDRPGLEQAIARIENGSSEGLIVARLDRFGRGLVDSIAQVDRIQRAGGTFVSVADGFDLTTETGQLVMHIMLALAEHELRRIRSNWSDARARAVDRGIHPTPTAPFGYRHVNLVDGPGRDTRLEPDPVTAPLVRELFDRRAGGETWSALGGWLEGVGARTRQNRGVWSLRALRDIIRNPVYRGVARHGEFVNEHAHELIVDDAAWHAAQRSGRQTVPRSDTPALLGPVLRCAGCRYRMSSTTRRLADGRLVRDYHCRNSRQRGGYQCPAPARVPGPDGLEEWVVDRVLAELPELAARATAERPDLEPLEAEERRARRAYEQVRDDARAQATLGLDEWLTVVASRRTEWDAARNGLAAAVAAGEPLRLPVPAEGLREAWDGLGVHVQRQVLGGAVQVVFVARAERGTPIANRTRIVWAGEPAVDTPRMGRRGYDPEPFGMDLDPGSGMVGG